MPAGARFALTSSSSFFDSWVLCVRPSVRARRGAASVRPSVVPFLLRVGAGETEGGKEWDMRPISHKAIRYLVGPGSSSLVRSRSVSFATLFRCQGRKNGRVDGPTKTHRKVSCPRTILFSPPALPASESEDNFSKLFTFSLAQDR